MTVGQTRQEGGRIKADEGTVLGAAHDISGMRARRHEHASGTESTPCLAERLP